MTILEYNAVVIDLPDGMTWTDEYAWRPVEQSAAYSIAGRLLIESTAKVGGRPLTLAGSETSGWISRDVLDLLLTAAQIAGQRMTLTLRDTSYAVAFNHTDEAAVQGTPVVDYSDPVPADYYIPKLRFFILPPT